LDVPDKLTFLTATGDCPEVCAGVHLTAVAYNLEAHNEHSRGSTLRGTPPSQRTERKQAFRREIQVFQDTTPTCARVSLGELDGGHLWVHCEWLDPSHIICSCQQGTATKAFLCDAVRTPIGRYGGLLAEVRADDLGAVPMQALLTRNPGAIEEVFFGCANQSGEDNRNVSRMSLLLAGLPASVLGVTLNRAPTRPLRYWAS